MPETGTRYSTGIASLRHVTQVLFGVEHTHQRDLRHSATSVAIGALVGAPFISTVPDSHGWEILRAPELRLGDDIVVPDVVGWRRDRTDLPPFGEQWASIAPDWVCEVLSPETEQIDRIDKLKIYMREQVRHVWLADPRARVLEVFRLDDGAWTPIAALSDGGAPIEPFAANELDVGLFWRF
jgi:Uma2 family endonuclease